MMVFGGKYYIFRMIQSILTTIDDYEVDIMDVIVYSTSTCPWCKKTKEWLEENKVKFKDIDVTQNAKARDEMIDKYCEVFGVKREVFLNADLRNTEEKQNINDNN